MTKAQESVSAATLLLDQGYHGFAASRAYYAMFYVAEALLASLGKSYSSHAGVLGAFGQEFAKTGKLDVKFHRWLIDGQDIRNVGDYGVGTEVSREQTVEVISRAEELIGVAQTHLRGEGGTEHDRS
ncbi:MAG: HEPN domain-containing protein [Candidatus Schekmanbacteria bacterium]|nr:HEPN domain-containing protein [Candidatus Schekmanbacteria bacterium]